MLKQLELMRRELANLLSQTAAALAPSGPESPGPHSRRSAGAATSRRESRRRARCSGRTAASRRMASRNNGVAATVGRLRVPLISLRTGSKKVSAAAWWCAA